MNDQKHSACKPCSEAGFLATLRAFHGSGGTGAGRTNASRSRAAHRSYRAVSRLLIGISTLCIMTAILPAPTLANPTVEAAPIFSTAVGLPDGRVYEQVSPTDKNGNEAGARTTTFNGTGGEVRYSVAAPDGNSVLFEGTGPMGEDPSPLHLYFVASKNTSAAGWSTRAIIPRARQSIVEVGGTLSKLEYVDPSLDLSHVMFEPTDGAYATPPNAPCGNAQGAEGEYQLYLSGSDPFVPATWLARPLTEDPIEDCAEEGEAGAPVGGTPNFSTVYFTFPGTLLPEDASRTSHAQGTVNRASERQHGEAWGFYEDREGALREAGVLPDGDLDQFGAVPAVSGHVRALEGNQVADGGERAFFVSPDPASCEQNGGHNNCALDPPELYVRENGEKTVLVSQDALLPPVAGLPARAPDGALAFTGTTLQHQNLTLNTSFVFASPDGSQAFFQSESDLTKAAQEASPGIAPKTYDFDINTGTMTYLPDVIGQFVQADADGSSLAFVKPAEEGTPAELDQWFAGPDGGSVNPVTQLPGQGVSEARMSSDGSVLVFLTSSNLPGGFNSGGFEQIYRYDESVDTLGCVSCPPHGVTPTGNAVMSQLRVHETGEESGEDSRGMVPERGVSADGSRIFFDTPDPLVPQDTNAGTRRTLGPGGSLEVVEQLGRDVYEWENGVVYLISSGKSPLNTYFLDNNEDGDDVFFATTEGLVPGDTDGAYDVYDARVPQPGDTPPPVAVPCEGAVCQGPPRVPTPLAAPTSSTFLGLGNPASEPEAAVPATTKATTRPIKCTRGYVKKKNKCVKKPKRKPKAKRSAKGAK